MIFLRTILRNHLPRTAFLRRILRIFPAPRKGFITHYTAYRFPSLKDAFHALGGMTPAFVFPSFVPAPGFPSLNRIPSVPSSPLFPPPALPAFPEGGLVRCDRLSRWGLSLPLAAVRCAFFCVFPLTAPLSLRGLPFLSLPCPLGRVAWVPPSLACRIPSNVLPRTPPPPQEKRACPRRGKNAFLYLK